jgi:hypothetical protein
MDAMPSTTRSRSLKPDAVCAGAVDLARTAAEETAGSVGVGEHLGVEVEAERVVSHFFACEHRAYRNWRWCVTVVRASRAKVPTVNEVVLLPGEGALLAPSWVPWAERIQAGDVAPGLLLPTPEDDPRLEPGFTGGDTAPDVEPADQEQFRLLVTELGLGRERVLSAFGRDEASERWYAGTGGPDNAMTRLAPAHCATCGFFVPVRGSLGQLFGVCANAYSASDGSVVSLDHGCGAHSSVSSEERIQELPAPAWETFEWDEPVSLFD